MISKYFIAIFIFLIVLFLYLHIHHNLVCSNDLEVYTVNEPSKDKLEEICNVKQPFIFQWYNKELLDKCTLTSLDDDYSVFDIQLRDTSNTDYNTEIYLPFLLKETINIFRNDKHGKYISENNKDFLTETGVIKNFKHSDSYLRPPLVSKCQYDFMFGSINSMTPLKYELNYRNYFYVTNGECVIKLIPPHYTKYLYLQKDYDNFEFRSSINPWNVQKEFKIDYEKTRCIDIRLKKGDVLFIPAYWWYSIKFTKMASICTFKYRTFMNILAISPYLVMSFLQGQNIKRKIVQKMDKIEEKIDKLEQIVIDDKKKQIRAKSTEDDNIEKFNSIREETAKELNKVKAITNNNLLNQYALIHEKNIDEQNNQQEQIDATEKLSSDNIERLIKNNNDNDNNDNNDK
jgi:hypothetical protein